MDCGVCIGGDSDGYWEFSDFKIVKARKPHKCIECDREIPVGMRYEKFSGKWEGDFTSHETCLDCANIRNGLSCNNSVGIGELWNEIREVFSEITTGCLQKIKTPSAKAYLLERWNEWKFQE